jgi:Tfp pilus assembly protein PilO
MAGEQPVTDTHAMRLVRRVVQEHQKAVVLIAAGFILNVMLYVMAVRPLNQSVATIEQRTLAAEQARTAAQAEFSRANGTLTGKDRATKELDTFYSKVLAQDLSGARRLTYGRVQRLAQESRLAYQGSRYEPVEARESTLTKLKVNVELTGSYPNLRSFIHAIESSPQFVVIENISLAEGTNEGSLRLAMDLSTYYRSTSR